MCGFEAPRRRKLAMGNGRGSYRTLPMANVMRRGGANSFDPTVEGAGAFGPGLFVHEAFAVPAGVSVDTMAMAGIVRSG